MRTILTLHDPETARAYYAEGSWQQETMYRLLLKHAVERPAAFALRDRHRRLTWRELAAWVEAVAADLHDAGLRRGDRVAIWLPNRAEGVVIFLACSRNGYVCVPSLHQNYTTGEILTLLERTSAAVLFAQPGYGADAARHDVFSAAPPLKRLYAVPARGIEGVPAGAHAFPSPGRVPAIAPDDNPDKVVYIAFTSGTTGMPKGVMHSDNTLLANGRAMVKDWHHDTTTICLSLSPLSHHIATVTVEQMLAAGFEMVVNELLPGEKPLDWILECGATYVMGVPTHAIDVLAEMRRRGLSKLGRVRIFYMAGAPIPRETARGFLDVGVTPQNIYGMTENGSHQYTLPTDDVDTIVATCGKACLGYEIRIWKADAPDIEAAPGEIGEIGGRGGVLTLGYFNNQAATEGSFNALGWFMSGDLGRLDAQGNLEIIGRKKDLIIRGGHNIYPARIEDLAHRHAGIVKAAAFPIADARLGERVCLAIVSREEAAPDAGEVLRHLDAVGLSRYDMPEYFISMASFPLTASGKVLKRALVEWVKTGRITPAPCRWEGS